MVVEKKTVTLKYPIEYEDPNEPGIVVRLEQLNFGRLKTKHLKLLPPSVFETEGEFSAAQLIPILPSILSSMAGIPEAAADEIDFEDLEQVVEVIGDFLGSTQAQSGRKPYGLSLTGSN